ncbi:MAG: carbon-nitrogen family hydrolase [Oscillospiraceae bacterium]|jgi:predicted amidohydrolase|nr:carbon-nitrogen family hydrolase [Oscillospiraceae bacterium]
MTNTDIRMRLCLVTVPTGKKEGSDLILLRSTTIVSMDQAPDQIFEPINALLAKAFRSNRNLRNKEYNLSLLLLELGEMRIAICQTDIIFENKQSNYQKAQEVIKKAIYNAADLILFPEMSFTGFSMNTEKTSEHNLYERVLSWMDSKELAIGFGWVKRNRDLAENHYTVLHASGVILSDYVKIHPFSFAKEDQSFVAGEKLCFFQLQNYVFSTAICYDLRFPELFQIMSKKASFIIVAANWPKVRIAHWNCLLRARAIENQCYILGVNCIGEQGHVCYSGDSAVINPNGETVTAQQHQDGAMLFDLYDNVEDYRLKFPFKQDRREDLYQRFR